MDFQIMREKIQIQHQEVYIDYNDKKQNIDSISFRCYPDKQRRNLIKFYKEAKPILIENGFLNELSIINESFRSKTLKNFYSSLIPISHFRTLYKWLGMEDRTISDEEIVMAQKFLLKNWEEKDFFPFLPFKMSSSV